VTDLDLLRAQLRARGELVLAVKVIPRSARTEFAGVMADGTLKVKVAAMPEKGKANAVLCDFLAREFNASEAIILSGETSQRKRVRLRI
jgi:uncharacterized protein